MTETTLGKLDPHTVSQKVSTAFMIAVMAIMLYVAGSLLHWAVTSKLSKNEVVEQSSITAEVRDRQLACLAKNIYHEAGYEPFEGKVAVAQVTLNRADHSAFPGGICEVIYQKNVIYQKVICQFSWACDRDTSVRPVNRAAYAESMEVAKKVLLEGFRLPGLKDALYYHADYINPGWRRQQIAHIGRHIFYR
jgi:spore germination cell wall hydrolase CwlJ-like protein